MFIHPTYCRVPQFLEHASLSKISQNLHFCAVVGAKRKYHDIGGKTPENGCRIFSLTTLVLLIGKTTVVVLVVVVVVLVVLVVLINDVDLPLLLLLLALVTLIIVLPG